MSGIIKCPKCGFRDIITSRAYPQGEYNGTCLDCMLDSNPFTAKINKELKSAKIIRLGRKHLDDKGNYTVKRFVHENCFCPKGGSQEHLVCANCYQVHTLGGV